MKAIIFGANGQDGFYLQALLQERNVEVIAVSRSAVKGMLQGDVKDRLFVEKLIKEQKPDYIFDFAALSTTQHTALFENHETITTGSIHILESVYQYSPHTKVFLSGSALQFENKGLAIKETDAFCANDAYSAARIYTTYLARYYRTLKLKVYVGYFFNHDSPLRDTKHLNKKIIDYVKRLKQGKTSEKLVIGNLYVQKEFNHAKDLMKAIDRLVNQDVVFEAVIGNGLGYSIDKWIEICFDLIQEDPSAFVCIDEGYVSPYQRLVCNPETIKSLGWNHQISIQELAKEMYDYEK